MTEPQEFDSTTPGGDLPPEPPPAPGEAGTDAGAGESAAEGEWTTGAESAGSQKGREWLSQLETMIQDIATQAGPVIRDIGAKAAELAAVAAVKAGPIAQKAAEVTTDVGQRFAERAQSVAADLRAENAAHTNGHAPDAPVDVTPPATEDVPPPPA